MFVWGFLSLDCVTGILSIPLRNTPTRVLNVGQPVRQCWVAGLTWWRGRGGGERYGSGRRHSHIHKPHNTINPPGFMLLCVCGALCVMKGAEYYIHLMIFEVNRVVCQECAIIWHYQVIHQIKLNFSPQGFSYKWEFWSGMLRGNPLHPYMWPQKCVQWFACGKHMQTQLQCVANAQSFLSLSCDHTIAVLRKPGEFQ